MTPGGKLEAVTTSAHGVDPKNEAFADGAELAYARESLSTGIYARQAQVMAGHLNGLFAAEGGLRGKRVLDVACGFGTNVAALSGHLPRAIYACDRSPAMIALLNAVLCGEKAIREYLSASPEKKIDGDALLNYLVHMSHEMVGWKGMQQHLGAPCQAVFVLPPKSALALSPADTYGLVDAVHGSHALHWMVNEIRLLFAGPTKSPHGVLFEATTISLSVLSGMLRPGGRLVLGGPKEFIRLRDQRVDEYYDRLGTNGHPLFQRFNEVLNRRLKADFDCVRPAPTANTLYDESDLPQIFERAGLKFQGLTIYDGLTRGDYLESLVNRSAMWLGATPLTMPQKIALAERVAKEIRCEGLRPEDLTPPHSLLFVMTAVKA